MVAAPRRGVKAMRLEKCLFISMFGSFLELLFFFASAGFARRRGAIKQFETMS